MEPLGILGGDKSMIKNILENIEYIEPDTSLPPDPGMCSDCVEAELHDLCDDCENIDGT